MDDVYENCSPVGFDAGLSSQTTSRDGRYVEAISSRSNIPVGQGNVTSVSMQMENIRSKRYALSAEQDSRGKAFRRFTIAVTILVILTVASMAMSIWCVLTIQNSTSSSTQRLQSTYKDSLKYDTSYNILHAIKEFNESQRVLLAETSIIGEAVMDLSISHKREQDDISILRKEMSIIFEALMSLSTYQKREHHARSRSIMNWMGKKCKLVERSLFLLGRCYTVTIHQSSGISLEEAKRKCAETDSSLADITSLDQQLALENFIRKLLPTETDEWYLWLGMTYDFSVDSPRSSNGQLVNASDVKWDSGFPSSSTSYTKVVLEVDWRSTTSQGLWNCASSRSLAGAVCEW